jgi:hypothetical protein
MFGLQSHYQALIKNIKNTLNTILIQKFQQDAHVAEFILSDNCSTCSLSFIITHLQEHKTTVTTASGNRYTVIDRVKFFTVKEYP